MNSSTNTTTVSSFEVLRNIFESGSQFLKQHRRRRAVGGDNISEQIVLDNVEITTPMVIGQPIGYSTESINKIRPQIAIGSYHEYTHLVFNGGSFYNLHFNRFNLPYESNNLNLLYIPELTIEINGGEFKEPVRFSNSRIGSVKITGGVFHSEVCFERGVYGSIDIAGGEFKKGLYFGQLINFDTYSPTFLPTPENTPTWTSKHNGIYNSLKISGGTHLKEIILDSCLIENELVIDGEDIEVDVTNLTSKNRLIIREGNCSFSACSLNHISFSGKRTTAKILVDISDSVSNSFSCEGYAGKDSLISFRNHKTNVCKFENFINYGGIAFNNLELLDRRIVFEDLHPSENAQALNIKAFHSAMFGSHFATGSIHVSQILDSYNGALLDAPELKEIFSKSSLTIVNSDLGKTNFFESRISGASFNFKSSKLTDIFLAGTKIPDFDQQVLQDTSEFNDPEQKRFALSQIRRVYENRGDQITAGEYFGKELEVRRAEARLNRKHFNERFPLRLSKISNDHGQDWIHAFMYLFGGGLVLWLIINLLILDFNDSPSLSDWIFLKNVPFFLQFLLPIHRYDLINDFAKDVAGFEDLSKIKEWTLAYANLIDAVWRIVSGYLVYQLIAAFRKHGKK